MSGKQNEHPTIVPLGKGRAVARPGAKPGIQNKNLENAKTSNVPEPVPIQRRTINPLPKEKIQAQVVPQQLFTVDNFLSTLSECQNTENYQPIESLVLQILMTMRNSLEIDKQLYLSIIFCAKKKSELFKRGPIFETLLALLRRDTSPAFKRNNQLPVLACNILLYAYQHISRWPIEFIEAYLDDAFGDRVWVDEVNAREFVTNIITVFPQVEGILTGEIQETTMKSNRNEENQADTMEEEYEEEIESSSSHTENSAVNISEQNRYPDEQLREHIKYRVLEIIQNCLAHQTENPKNLIKSLTTFCGYKEVRSRVSGYLEEWLNNPTTLRFAKELLSVVVRNTRQTTQEDIVALTTLLKFKIKGMHTQMYIDFMAQLLKNHPEYPVIALQQFIFNELVPNKQGINFKLLSLIYKSIPKNPEEELGLIFQSLLLHDASKAVARAVMKRFIKLFNHETDFFNLSVGLIKERSDLARTDDTFRFNFMVGVVDLLCLAQMLSVPPQFYESAKELVGNVPKEFRFTIARIQSEGVKWVHGVIPKYLPNIPAQTYTQLLRKLLFLEQISYITPGEFGNPEAEKLLLRLVTTGVPVYEDTLTRIVLMNLTKVLPLSNPDTLDILERLVCRAAATDQRNGDIMSIQNVQLAEAILKISLYQPPTVYEHVLQQFSHCQFAVTEWFWQTLGVLVILASYNPSTIGSIVWNFPSIRTLLEMIITRNWRFPPFSQDKNAEETAYALEARLRSQEKEMILSMENILAKVNIPDNAHAVVIDESNSILVNQLLLYNPTGPARQPTIAMIKKLQAYDTEFSLSRRLSACRSPDFLLDIMQRQGAEQSMSWLEPIIQAEPDILEVLPIACLCELLLISQKDLSRLTQLARLLSRLIAGLFESSTQCSEIIGFFLNKICTTQLNLRQSTKRALYLVLHAVSLAVPSTLTLDPENPSVIALLTIQGDEWKNCTWLSIMDTLPYSKEAKQRIIQEIHRVLLFESQPIAVAEFITYLYNNDSDLTSVAMDLSKLLLERKVVVPELLRNGDTMVSLFLKVFVKVVSPATVTSRVNDDLISIQFDATTKEEIRLPRIVAQGVVELLSHVDFTIKLDENQTYYVLYEQLVNKFFPGDRFPAKAYDIKDNSEYPLVTKDQALRLVRSRNRNIRLAGYQLLSEKELLSVLFTLGATNECVADFLKYLLGRPEVLAQVLADPQQTKKVEIRLQIYQRKGIKEASGLLQQLNFPLRESPMEIEMQKETEMVTEPTQVTPSRPTTPSLSDSALASLIEPIFLGPQATKYENFRKLIDTLVSAAPTMSIPPTLIEAIWAASDKQLRANKAKFVANLEQQTHLFLPIYYSLCYNVVKRSGVAQKLYEFFGAILSSTNNAALRRACRTLQSVLTEQPEEKTRLEVIVPTKIEKQQIIPAILQMLKDTTLFEDKFELLLRKCIQATNDQRKQKEELVEILVETVIQLQQSSKLPSNARNLYGLFFDWILILDYGMATDSLLKLIFSTDTSWLPFMLSIMMHNASWSTLEKIFNRLLSRDHKKEKIHPTAILTFVNALLKHPSSWAGSMLKGVSGKQVGQLNRLGKFTPETARNFCDCMLSEMELVSDIGNARYELLNTIATQNSENLYSMVLHLSEKSNQSQSKHVEDLLSNLYYAFPNSLTFSSNEQSLLNFPSSVKTSQLDLLLHSIMRHLTDPNYATVAYNICKKIAASHPPLVLRYLKTIASVLQGRVAIPLSEFVERQYHKLFLHVLSILDALRPHIFKHSNLNEILQTYFDLLAMVRVNNRNLVGLISKFVDFLCYYALEQNSAGFLIKYTRLFIELAPIYPEVRKMQLLLEMITRPSSVSESKMSALPLAAGDLARVHLVLQKAMQTRSGAQNSVLALETLKELDSSSLKAPMLLGYFVSDLIELAKSPSNSDIRDVSLRLLLRHVHFSPKDSETIMGAYLDIIRSSSSLSSPLLSFAPEFFQFSQDMGELFLRELFRLGKPAVSHLIEIVKICELLNKQ